MARSCVQTAVMVSSSIPRASVCLHLVRSSTLRIFALSAMREMAFSGFSSLNSVSLSARIPTTRSAKLPANITVLQDSIQTQTQESVLLVLAPTVPLATRSANVCSVLPVLLALLLAQTPDQFTTKPKVNAFQPVLKQTLSSSLTLQEAATVSTALIPNVLIASQLLLQTLILCVRNVLSMELQETLSMDQAQDAWRPVLRVNLCLMRL